MTSIHGVRFLVLAEEDDGKKTLGPVVNWIGIIPGSLEGEGATTPKLTEPFDVTVTVTYTVALSICWAWPRHEAAFLSVNLYPASICGCPRHRRQSCYSRPFLHRTSASAAPSPITAARTYMRSETKPDAHNLEAPQSRTYHGVCD